MQSSKAKSKWQESTSRSGSGNMLTLISIIGFVILIVALWAIDLLWLHFLNKKELSAAEKVAMAAAVALNRDDNVGQMNYMLAHCRELCCNLRFDEAKAEDELEKGGSQKYKLITQDLCRKAHDAALQLEKQRAALQEYRIGQALVAARNAVASAGSPGAAHMGGIATSGVSMVEDKCSFGCIKQKVGNASEAQMGPSNVEPTKYYFDEKIDKLLLDYDKKFIDEEANLYKVKPALDLNYPGGSDDQDLSFQLSSLPACINGYIAPPRLIQSSEYMELAPFRAGVMPRFIPSAVCIVLKLDVKDTQSGSTTQLMAPGIALCGGAAPDP